MYVYLFSTYDIRLMYYVIAIWLNFLIKLLLRATIGLFDLPKLTPVFESFPDSQLVNIFTTIELTEYIFCTSNERKQLKTVTWELSVETCNTPIFYKFSANSVNCQIFYDNVYNSQYTLYSYIYRVSNIFEP